MSEKPNSSSTFAFIVGIAIGAAVVYLTATENGRKMTAKVKKAAQVFLEDLEVNIDKPAEFSDGEEHDLSDRTINLPESTKGNIEYIKDIQNRGRTVSRRFFKKH